jgi:hypothetical protein
MIGKNIASVLGICLISMLLWRIAPFSRVKSSATVQPLSAQPAVLKSANIGEKTQRATTLPPQAVLPPISDGHDGKEVLASDGRDGKTVLESDGKTVLPTEGKETLSPVGELTGQRGEAVAPATGGPPTEFLNKTAAGNPLLTPPNPVNVSGPVVSAETKAPQ